MMNFTLSKNSLLLKFFQSSRQYPVRTYDGTLFLHNPRIYDRMATSLSEVVELPGSHTQAKTYDELLKRTKEAISLYLEASGKFKQQRPNS